MTKHRCLRLIESLRPSRGLRDIGIALSVSLTSCGTDVEWLLERDGKLVADADRIAAAAEAIDPEATTSMYDAEDAKRAACQTIYESISEQIASKPSFGEEFVSDLGLFVAYLVPIEEVERCAKAEAAYEAVVEAIGKRVEGHDAEPAGSDGAGN